MARLCPKCGSTKLSSENSYDYVYGSYDNCEATKVVEGVEVACKSCGWFIIVNMDELQELALDFVSSLKG